MPRNTYWPDYIQGVGTRGFIGSKADQSAPHGFVNHTTKCGLPTVVKVKCDRSTGTKPGTFKRDRTGMDRLRASVRGKGRVTLWEKTG